MKIIKNILSIVLITFISICGFGGGCLFWIALALIIKPSPIIMQIMFYITMIIPVPFCWHIAPKLSEKLF